MVANFIDCKLEKIIIIMKGRIKEIILLILLTASFCDSGDQVV